MTRQPWSAQACLEAWGLRVTGASLKSPLALSTGGAGGTDDEWQAMMYVESVAGFEQALPVLRWVFAQFKQPETYPVRFPGELLPHALIRHGWYMHLGQPPKKIPCVVLEQFIRSLEEALAERPFIPTRDLEEETPVSAAQSDSLRTISGLAS